MSRIRLSVNGIVFDFEEEKMLAMNEKTCAMCILNSNVCESICLNVNKELYQRKTNINKQ